GRGAAPGRVEARRGAPDLQQDLLRDFLGLRRVPQHPADQPVDRAREPVVDLLERGLVAPGHVREQAAQVRLGGRASLLALSRPTLAHLPATHAPYSTPSAPGIAGRGN